MDRLLTTLKRGFMEKIGWKRLGIAASLVIIVLAVATLVRTLKGVDAVEPAYPAQIAGKNRVRRFDHGLGQLPVKHGGYGSQSVLSDGVHLTAKSVQADRPIVGNPPADISSIRIWASVSA